MDKTQVRCKTFASLTITAARKMNHDCKSFIATYPSTVCTAMNMSNNVTRTVDSSIVQPTCKKIDDDSTFRFGSRDALVFINCPLTLRLLIFNLSSSSEYLAHILDESLHETALP